MIAYLLILKKRSAGSGGLLTQFVVWRGGGAATLPGASSLASSDTVWLGGASSVTAAKEGVPQAVPQTINHKQTTTTTGTAPQHHNLKGNHFPADTSQTHESARMGNPITQQEQAEKQAGPPDDSDGGVGNDDEHQQEGRGGKRRRKSLRGTARGPSRGR